jgi:tetrahydromethanopterin S-methyltransferase subunit B
MADMSFKQAKELVEKLEFTEISLKNTMADINISVNNMNRSLQEQRQLLQTVPKNNYKLGIMKIIVSLNIGVMIGLALSRYLL